MKNAEAMDLLNALYLVSGILAVLSGGILWVITQRFMTKTDSRESVAKVHTRLDAITRDLEQQISIMKERVAACETSQKLLQQPLDQMAKDMSDIKDMMREDIRERRDHDRRITVLEAKVHRPDA